MFKCLFFVQRLTASTDAEIANKLEQEQKITLQNLADEGRRILNLRADMTKMEEREISHILAIWN